MSDKTSFTEDEWHACIKVLQVLSRRPKAALDEMILKGLVTKIARDAKKRRRSEACGADRAMLAEAQTWQANAAANHPTLSNPLTGAPAPGPSQKTTTSAKVGSDRSLGRARLNTPRQCYVCKQLFFEVHYHYHMHCPTCADADYQRRFQRADLAGRAALLTGGRIKIGYQTALRLLRDGARVILTTRFPHDAVRRFVQEKDFSDWSARLRVHGLDLRNLPAVERFAEYLMQTEPGGLDILINNAAQTIRRQTVFFDHLRAGESESLSPALAALVFREGALSSHQINSAITPAAVNDPWHPLGLLDLDGQQVDLRPENSWSARATQVSTPELLESILVNQTAPFILACRLRPLMTRSAMRPRFVINVSAMEGQFARNNKTPCHPHTNMAKAALNMFTRTSARDFATEDIWMNSVDTGWITDESPFPGKSRSYLENHFVPPLDPTDGMARIYDPIVRGVTCPALPWYGHFLKNFEPYPW